MMEATNIARLEIEISDLRKLLRDKENELSALRTCQVQERHLMSGKLTKEDIERFSRQIIIPSIGCKGQLALKSASVLIVGAGGLGCPAAQYLAGSGVGHIGLVDYDEVERSNLHRQLLHSEETIGQSKVSSAYESLKKLNRDLKISQYHTQIDSANALDLVKSFDLVIDATDNVASRYLLNDACVISSKPLVSGSALRLEGQITVYNFKRGPCYRCIFPKPPPPETVTNCGDGGVLGAVPGIIGVLQALEAIKIILEWPGVLSGQLLLYSADFTTFRTVRLRGRNPSCDVCGDTPSVSKLIDYEQFCRAKATDKDSTLKLLKKEQRVSPEFLHDSFICKKEGVLVDVRDPEEFEMCAISHSINIPLKQIDDSSSVDKILEMLEDKRLKLESLPVPVNKRISRHQANKAKLCHGSHIFIPLKDEEVSEATTELNNTANKTPIFSDVKHIFEILYVVCRRGNDSQKAVLKLENSFQHQNVAVYDLEGGLHAWSRKVDSNFPIY